MLPFSYSYREMEVYKSLSFVCKIYRIYYLLTLYVRLYKGIGVEVGR